MTHDQQFEYLIGLLQSGSAVQNREDRSKLYVGFDFLYRYLEDKEWNETNLVEKISFSEESFFQNIAEGYYRLGFVEHAFFDYSKLIYELWYKKALDLQETIDKRIHKGTQVHQIAIIYDIFGERSKSWVYFFAGLIEDVLTGRAVEESQAFRALRRLNLPKKTLVASMQKVSNVEERLKLDSLELYHYLRKSYFLPSYEENNSMDYNMLDDAERSWRELVKKGK